MEISSRHWKKETKFLLSIPCLVFYNLLHSKNCGLNVQWTPACLNTRSSEGSDTVWEDYAILKRWVFLGGSVLLEAGLVVCNPISIPAHCQFHEMQGVQLLPPLAT